MQESGTTLAARSPWRTPVPSQSLALMICLALSGCALFGRSTPVHTRIFVSNYKDDTVSVIDGEDSREIKVLPVPNSPYGLAVRSTKPLVAVANSAGSTITLVDPIRLEVLRTIEVGKIPLHAVFSVDGKLLFVALPIERQIAVVDVDTAGVVDRIDIETNGKPKRVAVSPDGRRLYVLVHARQGAVVVLDIATRSVIATIPVGAFPTDFGMSRDGRRIVAASFDDSTITVIDTESLTSLATYPVENGFGLVVHPTKPIVYSMASFDDAVHVVNYETGAPITDLDGRGPTYSAISPDGSVLWIVNEDGNNVVKLDTETNQAIARVGVGSEPQNAVLLEFP